MSSYKRIVVSVAITIAIVALALWITPKLRKQAAPPAQAPHGHHALHDAHDAVKSIENADQFAQHVTQAKGMVVVDFFAHWCGACRAMMPIYHEVAHEMAHSASPDLKKISFCSASVEKDNLNSIADSLNIKGIPSFAFYKDGSLIEVKAGYMAKENFIQVVKDVFKVR